MNDVIIVGAGIAGLICAKDCINAGLKVTLVHQGQVDHSSSSFAQGGIAGPWLSNDSPTKHMEDTILAGAGLCDTNIVQSICNQAPTIIQYLIDSGVPFDQHDNGDYKLTKEGAHSLPRIFHVKDHTGNTIIQTLFRNLESHQNIRWVNDSLQSLIKGNNNQIIGIKTKSGNIFSHHIILATGGFAQLFSKSTNPKGTIGQGIALAFLAGATLGDLEFIQFHPTVYCKNGFPPLLISEALRGEGAFLVNKNNERFMSKYHSMGDLAPRDIVSRAIVNEINTTLNITPLLPSLPYRFPTICHQLLKRHFDINTEFKIPIQPLAHYTIGGIVANLNGKTSLPGLYAIGECATTGFHGANRLASNSLLEATTMARMCAQTIINQKKPPKLSTENITHITLPHLTIENQRWLGQICHNALGVKRSKFELNNAITNVSQHPLNNHPMSKFILAILESAYHRQESRGGHFYQDYPNANNTPQHSTITNGQEIVNVDNLTAISTLI